MWQLHIFLALLIITLTLSNTAHQNQLDRKAWRVQLITTRWRLGSFSLPCGSYTQVSFVAFIESSTINENHQRAWKTRRMKWPASRFSRQRKHLSKRNLRCLFWDANRPSMLLCKKGQNVGWGFREILDLIDIERTVHSNFKRNFTIFCRYKSTMNLETAK